MFRTVSNLSPIRLLTDDGRVRILYARATPLRKGAGGALISIHNKSGDPACSAAASAWRRKQATTETYKKLAACRLAAQGLSAAKHQRLAGQDLKASALEHRVAEGKVGKGQRKALAKDLKGLLEAKRKGRAEDKEKASLAAAVTPKTDENQPTTATPPEASKVNPETKPAEASPEPKPDLTGPYSLEQHGAIVKRIASGDITADELRQHFGRLAEHEGAIRAELTKRTLKQLAPRGHGSATKKEVVDSIIRNMKQRYVVGGSFTWNPMGEKFEDGIRRYLAKTTDEDIQGAASERKQARAEAEKALTNPETVEEYRRFVETRGESALNPEQKAKWDDIRATARRDRDKQTAAREAIVPQVKGVSEGLSIDVKEGFNAKKGAPTYVAVLNQRVERDQYDDLNRKAKQLGGYYSAFRGPGAIPGFQFPTREAAEKFKGLLSGSVDTAEDRESRDAETRERTAEKLRDLAGATHDRAQETLGADRLRNTARRAEMAAGVEARARAEAAQAKTLGRIADGIADGSLKHLSGVKAKSHVEELDAALRDARNQAIRKDIEADPKAHRDPEEWHREPTAADVEHARYPYPRLWASDLKQHAAALADVPGLKNIGKRLGSKADRETAPKFKTQGGGYKFNGGRLLDPEAIEKEHGISFPDAKGKKVRVHASYDWRLSQQGQGHGPFYTADGGKSFGVSPEVAVSAAYRRGNPLDLVDPPKDEMLTLDSPRDIRLLEDAAKKLRNHPDRDLRRLGESLHADASAYNRLQAADITNPAELRAALREYMPLKAQRDKEDPIKAKERALIGRKIEGFFPTPRPVIDRLLDAADVRPGQSVLEPSAGKGDIADAVKEQTPDAEVHAIEPNASLREILEAKGHNLTGHDFLEHQGEYDRIIMNPPFERGQDVEHVQHGFKQLKPGGKLVAVMSEGPFNRQDAKSREFRDWLNSVGGESEKLDEGSFAGREAFRATGVNTRIVTIQKPDRSGSPSPPIPASPTRTTYARLLACCTQLDTRF